MSFAPSYPGAIPFWAHVLNYYGPGNPNSRRYPNGEVIPCVPVALVFHTPEEPSDNREVTPGYFAAGFIPPSGASTRFYHDNDGDVYQMVPEPWGAIANGLDGKPRPSWATPGLSLNLQTDNTEIEGYASTLQRSITPRQWASLVDWSIDRCVRFGIPPDRTHLVGHYEISQWRSDPGPWLLTEASGFVAEVGYRVTEIEKKLKELGQYVLEDRIRLGKVEGSAAFAIENEALMVTGRDAQAEARLRFVFGAAGKPWP